MVGKPTDDNKVQLEVENTTYYKGTLNADNSYTYSNEAEGTPVASFLNQYNTSLPENTTFTLRGYKSLLNRPAATATPASVIPRTADSFPLALLIVLAIVSCGALGILYTAKKRHK